jgi:hypothetical protein
VSVDLQAGFGRTAITGTGYFKMNERLFKMNRAIKLIHGAVAFSIN